MNVSQIIPYTSSFFLKHFMKLEVYQLYKDQLFSEVSVQNDDLRLAKVVIHPQDRDINYLNCQQYIS